MGLIEHYIDVSALRLHCLEWTGDAPPLLFVHGSSFNAWTWEAIVNGLAPSQAYAIDVRGHGDSSSSNALSYRDWTAYGADIAEMIDRLDLRDVTIIGHSAGCAWSVYAALQRLDRVAGMVLIDPVFYAPADPAGGPGGGSIDAMVERTRRRRSEWNDWSEARGYFTQRVPFSGFDRRVLERFIETGLRQRDDGVVVLKCATDMEAEMYAGQGDRDVRPFLHRLDFPVLIVEASETNILTPDRAQEIARLLPHAERVTVPDTTHFLPFERPQEISRRIREFLSARM